MSSVGIMIYINSEYGTSVSIMNWLKETSR